MSRVTIEAPVRPQDLFVPGRESPQGEGMRSLLPLGEFSRFIVEDQPRFLTGNRLGELDVRFLVELQRERLTALNPRVVQQIAEDPKRAAFASLDLGFGMSAVIFSGGEPSRELQGLNAYFAEKTGLPEEMTFQKIISINSRLPFEQMRTFTTGEVAESERMFYYGHDLMDRNLQGSVEDVQGAIETLAHGMGIEGALVYLQQAGTRMGEFAEFMRKYSRMPVEHFSVFRQYLASYPDNKTRNASGAFIGLPRLNLRLVGTSQRYDEFLGEALRYLPVDEQPDVITAHERAKNGEYLVALCESMPEGYEKGELAQAIAGIIEPLFDSRRTHLALVMNYVKGAVTKDQVKNFDYLLDQPEEPILGDNPDTVRGTAGFAPAPLLLNMMRMDRQALKKLQVIAEGSR